jgi:hypothetical protein
LKTEDKTPRRKKEEQKILGRSLSIRQVAKYLLVKQHVRFTQALFRVYTSQEISTQPQPEGKAAWKLIVQAEEDF